MVQGLSQGKGLSQCAEVVIVYRVCLCAQVLSLGTGTVTVYRGSHSVQGLLHCSGAVTR